MFQVKGSETLPSLSFPLSHGGNLLLSNEIDREIEHIDKDSALWVGFSLDYGQDLDEIWEQESSNWAGAGEAAIEQAEPVYQQTPELSPEQLRLISAHFEKVAFTSKSFMSASLLLQLSMHTSLCPQHAAAIA